MIRPAEQAKLLFRMAEIDGQLAGMSDYMVNAREVRPEMDGLLELGFVEYNSKSTLYKITEDGRAAARRLEEFAEWVINGGWMDVDEPTDPHEPYGMWG